MTDSAVRARIDHAVTSGTFSLDGQTFDVDNNVWVIGDDSEVVIVDAAHTAPQIVDAVAGRNVVAVVVTHGHNDHVTVAPELAYELHAPILLHPGDDMLWQTSHPDEKYWNLDAGQRIGVAGTEIEVIHTPGHSPGSVCLYLPEAGALFSGIPCSMAGRVRPGGPTAISRRSSTPSGIRS